MHGSCAQDRDQKQSQHRVTGGHILRPSDAQSEKKVTPKKHTA
jgi:hypothetical protein